MASVMIDCVTTHAISFISFFLPHSTDYDIVPVFARKGHFRSVLQEKSLQAPAVR